MPQYDIYVLCSECGSVHPMGIGIFLDAAPFDDQSIEQIYEKNFLPPQLQAIEGHQTLCLKTGKRFIQNDLNKIFLKANQA
jgi:hypothetical protein